MVKPQPAAAILLPWRPHFFRRPAMTFRPLPARAPAALLREAKPLKALFNQAQRIDRLQHLLESQLQPAAREHCHVASWREGCLLLIITDGHWATRLRYQQKRLLKQLQALEEFATLTKILFKVQPPTAERRAAVAQSACPAAPRKTSKPPPTASATPSCAPPSSAWPRHATNPTKQH